MANLRVAEPRRRDFGVMSWRIAMLLILLLILYRLLSGSRGDDLRAYDEKAVIAANTYTVFIAIGDLRNAIAEAEAGDHRDLSRINASQMALRRLKENDPAQRARLSALD